MRARFPLCPVDAEIVQGSSRVALHEWNEPSYGGNAWPVWTRDWGRETAEAIGAIPDFSPSRALASGPKSGTGHCRWAEDLESVEAGRSCVAWETTRLRCAESGDGKSTALTQSKFRARSGGPLHIRSRGISHRAESGPQERP